MIPFTCDTERMDGAKQPQLSSAQHRWNPSTFGVHGQKQAVSMPLFLSNWFYWLRVSLVLLCRSLVVSQWCVWVCDHMKDTLCNSVNQKS